MRRWASEPLLTAAIGMVLYLAWMLLYSWQLASSGVTPSGGAYATGWDFAAQTIGAVVVVGVPVMVWAGLAIAGGFLVRRRSFGFRLLSAWLAAVVLCLPFAIAAAVGLAANDGWRGLGIISLLVPAAAPLVILPLYCVAAAALQLGHRLRLSE